jgi:hypothetical protein
MTSKSGLLTKIYRRGAENTKAAQRMGLKFEV